MSDMSASEPRETYPPLPVVGQLTYAELRKLDVDSVNRAREAGALNQIMRGFSDEEIIAERK